MATMEQLEARAARMRLAEAAATDALAAGMRELAVELPDGSKLALQLAEASQRLAKCAGIIFRYAEGGGTWPTDGTVSRVELFMLERMRETVERYEGEVA